MGTRILRGRGLQPDDRAATPRVMVVSESMGKALWPGKDPLGECVRVGSDSVPCTTVVGIAEDMVQRDITGGRRFQYYMPLEQFQPRNAFALLLRTRGEPRAQQEAVRKALQNVMPGQSYITTRLFGEMVDRQRRSWRLGATMFVAFGVLALVVAAVGLYGVIGYNVAQRMHELGVRIALGAQSRDVVKLVVGQGLSFALVGVAIGIVLALWAGHWIQPLLFQQSAKDPAIYLFVGALLVLVALVASAAPALRATRADPNAALRSD
jgi:hypothetical protein